jgi:uncharacterized protein YeaO (DUF488 family)
MSIRIVQLGSPRSAEEGLRIGTVRRPPRGIPKNEYAARDFYDVWLPELSPSPDLVAEARSALDAKDWTGFERKFRNEMNQPSPSRLLDLLAALSRQTSFAIGCYCKDEHHCHRFVLRELLVQRGAEVH